MSRRVRSCQSCGTRTSSKVGLCAACKPTTPVDLDPADILEDGDWVLRPGSGGIKDWVPWEEEWAS